MTEIPQVGRRAALPPAAAALRRSFDIYDRDRARTERMDALQARLLPPGALAFDIGAHLGDRTGSFLRRGARVVTVEPQQRLARALRLIYGRRSDVTLYHVAMGAKPGRTILHLNTAD